MELRKHLLSLRNERVQVNGLRYYRPKGSSLPPYPSVTTVLTAKPEPELDAWKESTGEWGEKIARAAANRGTIMHEMIEHYLNGNHDLLAAQTYFAKKTQKYTNKEREIGKRLFYGLYHLGWMDELQEIVGTEIKLYSEKLRFAGTADLIAILNSKLQIIDFKTSKKPKQSPIRYFLQAAAYWMLVWDEISTPPNGAQIWILSESGNHQRFVLEQKKLHYYGKKFLKLRNKFEAQDAENTSG